MTRRVGAQRRHILAELPAWVIAGMTDILIVTLVTFAPGSGGTAVAVAELDRRDALVTVHAEPDPFEYPEPVADPAAALAAWEAELVAELAAVEPVAELPEPRTEPEPEPIDYSEFEDRRVSVSREDRHEMWFLTAHAEYLRADEDCRGNLLSLAGLRADVDPFDLWSGSARDAARYASRELRDWWERHGRTSPVSVLGGARAAAGAKALFDAAGAR